MCKIDLRKVQMPEADITRAQLFAADLLRFETRGPGDTANAMRRVAQRAAVPFSKLWALRYRPPKAVASHILSALEAAHAREVERQLRKLAHDAEITARIAGPSHPAVVAAEAVLRASGRGAEGAHADVAAAAAQPASARPPLVKCHRDLPLWRAAEPRP
ncbi:hypothetical protein [Methylobacterium organophilum]|uniref:Uncharacterized protein n=1 Tax=Methylobacterium organophilum TaxID=410 RepID=A0ABQ4TDK1_METOR|nr:hypothetical protein [Methylobacterium organophilum]GJE29761.1 hypothetical protein LKMONMHP_4647 [Methylobacterium organophilum]